MSAYFYFRRHTSKRALLLWTCATLWAGCGGSTAAKFRPNANNVEWFGHRERPTYVGRALNLRWSRRLTSELGGTYIPAEYATPAISMNDDRVYVGSSSGKLLIMSSSGAQHFSFPLGSIQGQPALVKNGSRTEVYLGTEDGHLVSIDSSTGKVRWKKELGREHSIRQRPVLTSDAVYFVTDSDLVVAMSRKNGDVLWRYERPLPEGFSVEGHAGLAIEQGKLITGFTDGVVVALDPTDGRVVWERDTSVDVVEESSPDAPRFTDVDTTPIVIDDRVYVASFSAGMYALLLSNGGVDWFAPEHSGVVGITATVDGSTLVLSSADHGVLCLGLLDRRILWKHTLKRGSPTLATVTNELVLVGETAGSFLALTLEQGTEVGRIDSGRGFSAPATVSGNAGYVVSNGGTLFAFDL